MLYVLDKIGTNSKKVYNDLIENYVDTEQDEDEDLPQEDETSPVNQSIDKGEEAPTDVTEQLLTPEKDKKETSVYEQSPGESSHDSLDLIIKKQAELTRKRLRAAALKDEIEEIGIRDLFREHVVKALSGKKL